MVSPCTCIASRPDSETVVDMSEWWFLNELMSIKRHSSLIGRIICCTKSKTMGDKFIPKPWVDQAWIGTYIDSRVGRN